MAKWKKKDDEIPLTFFQSLIDQDLSNCFAQKPTDWQGVLQAATSGPTKYVTWNPKGKSCKLMAQWIGQAYY